MTPKTADLLRQPGLGDGHAVCTSTWALSKSVPILKVTVSDMLPSLAHWADMLQHIFDAVDLALLNGGGHTVSAMTWGFAPG